MKTVYIVHGLKRSGNHAIINWILAQRPIPFYNNIVPISPLLSGHKDLPPRMHFADWLRQKDTSLVKRIRTKLSRRVMVSLEDHTLDYQPFFEDDILPVNVIIVRDPINLFASRIRKASSVDLTAYPERYDAIMRRAVSIWISHAKEVVCESETLHNKVCIYFNRWYDSVPYRKQICEQFGAAFTDKHFTKVSSKGGGSSFDALRYDGHTEHLNVLNRRDQLNEAEQRLLSKVLDNQELTRLAQAIEALVINRHPVV